MPCPLTAGRATPAGDGASAKALVGTAATTSAAATPAILPKKCTGRWPVHSERKTVTDSPITVSSGPSPDEPGSAAFATPGRSRSGHGLRSRGRRAGRCTLIILPVVDISVHYAVIVPVGPDRAGE